MSEPHERDEVITRTDNPPQGPQNLKERIYEKLRIPLWLLDTLLILLFVALLVALILGIANGNQ